MAQILTTATTTVSIGGMQFIITQAQAQELVLKLQQMQAIALNENKPQAWNGKQLING